MSTNERIKPKYSVSSVTKRSMGGLVVANIAYDMTGESGYVLRINNITFIKRFGSIEDAKIVADKFITKKAEEYLQEVTKK